MPPRYAYWTILVDEQPTAFRAALQEDLAPTFKRLKEKHASARMVWFQNGKIWNSRLDAQEAMRERGERGRAGDSRQRQGGGFRDRNRDRAPREERDPSGKLAWTPKSEIPSPKPQAPRLRQGYGGQASPKPALAPREHLLRRSVRDAKPEWKPKGDRPEWKPKGDRAEWKSKGDRPQWKPKADRPQWKPKGDRPQSKFKSDRPQWSPKGDRPQSKFKSDRPQSKPRSDRAQWKPKTDGRSQREKLEWRPKGEASGPSTQPPRPKPSTFAKATVDKQAQSPKPQVHSRTGRDKNWRPGGEHRDPRQKYKDAKKAKWTRFKQTIRKRWESKQEGAPKKKRRDDD